MYEAKASTLIHFRGMETLATKAALARLLCLGWYLESTPRKIAHSPLGTLFFFTRGPIFDTTCPPKFKQEATKIVVSQK